MNLYVSGLNHKTAPIEFREKYSWSPEERNALLDALKNKYPSVECVLVSTCNRTEVYIYSQENNFCMEELEAYLCAQKGLQLYVMKKYLYVYAGIQAVKHLFRVAAGLDSLVLGEDQILGQIRNAHHISLQCKASGGILNTLFRYAVTTAKKVKTATALSQNSISIGSVAVKAMEKALGESLSEKTALIIGAGEMGKLILKNLSSKGVSRIYITNRTLEKAHTLAQQHQVVRCVDYTSRYAVIEACDVIVSCTGSPHYTITRELLEKSLETSKPRVFVDLAIPRDMDISIQELLGVLYYNIDTLEETAQDNLAKRKEEASKAEAMILEDVTNFEKWFLFRDTLPLIQDIRSKTERLIEEKMAKSMMSLKQSSEAEKELFKASLTDTVEAILHQFVYSIRDHGDVKELDAYFQCMKESMKQA